MTDVKGRPNKVRSSGIEGVCRKLAADGLGYREISEELKRRGHDVSYSSVARFLSEEADERREIARDVASEQAHTDIPLVTKSLRKWVGDIGGLVTKTIEAIEKEDDPIEQRKQLNYAASAVATLVNAGSKAAKLLHDITAGAEPAAAADAFLAEAQAILEKKRQREAEREDEEGAELH